MKRSSDKSYIPQSLEQRTIPTVNENTTLNDFKSAVVIWGTQLSTAHHSALQAHPDAPIFIIESRQMCQRFKYHKQKLAFVLTAMREYADELRSSGRTVHYIRLEDTDDSWFTSLGKLCETHGIATLAAMRQNDRRPQQRLEAWCKQQEIRLETTPNAMFLTSTSAFNEWAEEHKQLRMEQFYRWQRQRLDILMQENGKPEGDRWNYDSENRKPLPKDFVPPRITFPPVSKHRADVLKLIDTYFADHPGDAATNWLPVNRQQARDWLQQFIAQRFEHFGDYEDAMLKGQTFLHHSAISALLNIGLLHPQEVINAALQADVPLASKEGFVRQIIGWREFVFGLYNYKPADWKDDNFFNHRQHLPDWWWQLDGADEAPLTDVLSRLRQYGYSHHIERLMVLGNYMLLAQYDPREVYDWFMSMYVDAYEWVMVPNIIGMSQYADGGLEHGGFATKPYISGSNYLQKMGKWWPSTAASKESEWTQMYWEFLAQHEEALANNFRLRPLFKAARRNSKK